MTPGLSLAVAVGIPGLLVVAGWFLAHWLTARRELAAKRRESRLRALEAAYMRIATSSNRPLTSEIIERIETFVSEIQLYGTPRQVELMGEIVHAFKKPNNTVYYDVLLADLRDTIRHELRLEAIKGYVWWVRIPPPSAAEGALPTIGTPESPSKISEASSPAK